jgi:lipopolysaccharide/colanic/teichoic acid biosynthesis glycosyltransferase
MTKRLFDLLVALTLFIITFPIIVIAILLIVLHDGKWPFYSPLRAGRGGRMFHMHKLRSMVVGADKTQMDTTSTHDPRVTPVGRWLRRFKLDELPQLWNVLVGDISLVGPRPQIDREVALYTEAEKRLLSVRPGVTDFSSIIFSDLAEIVAPYPDANIAYNQLVRPWKSRLGLFYIDHSSLALDVALLCLTALAVISRACALKGVVKLLEHYQAPPELIAVCRRDKPLAPTPPLGASDIVTSRQAL